MRLLLSALVALVLFALPASAQQSEGGYLYSPEGCDFQMTFPAEPRVTRRCHDQLDDKCSLMSTYTQVFDLNATINVYASCLPSKPDFRKSYTSDLLRMALLARPGVSDLETYDITFQETDNALMGALLGAGDTPNGQDTMVYVAEIWVGDNSVFTLEGELIGEQMEDADKLFATILRSLHHKNDSNPDEPQAKDDAPAAETTEAAPAQEASPATDDAEKTDGDGSAN